MTLVAALLLAGTTLTVTETAGIRRFSYPVTVKVPGQPGVRLLEDGKVVPCQFQGGELDFNVSLGPREQRTYTLEQAPLDLSRPVVREEGIQLVVAFSESLQFAVPRDLLGFLASVRTARTDYVRRFSPGLLIRYRDSILYRAGGVGPWGTPTKARIVKQGPLACALEFTSTEALRGNRSVESVVRMDFPRSKSWVKATWTVQDPEGFVAGLGLDLNLNLAAGNALFDFGAGSTVYGQLRAGQSAGLAAGPQSWRILLGPDAYATGEGRSEGWAHAMDRERATAVAVEDFGLRREDRIEVSADGALRIDKDTQGRGAKSLVFWLHFVGMPVQVGAATSPQSMLAPLKVELQ